MSDNHLLEENSAEFSDESLILHQLALIHEQLLTERALANVSST